MSRPLPRATLWLGAHLAVGFLITGYVILGSLGQSPAPGTWGLIALLGSVVGIASFAAHPTRAGVLYGAILMSVVTAVAYPFLHPTFVGAGDAQDYFRMFADFIDQHRAGVRAVFVGKTGFTFEGTVHSTRTSPMFYHVGALVDLFSGRTLDHLILEKITLWVFSIAAAWGFYLSSVRGLGLRPLHGVLMACLFSTAPAIVAPLYFSDMYATVTALPFLVLFLMGLVLLSDDPNGPGGWLLSGMGSGGLFWTHPPLGVWAHLAALFCLLLNVRRWRAMKPGRWLYLIPILLVLAYPIISTIQLGATSVSDPRALAAAMRKGYSDTGGRWTHLFWTSISDSAPNSFKLWSSSWVWGAPVLVAWLAVLVCCRRLRRIWPLLLCSAILIFLMNGVAPQAARWLWKLVPDVLVRITLNWPLERFNPIVSCAALIGLAAVLALLPGGGARSWRGHVASVVLGLFLGLNLFQVWTMQAAPKAETLPVPLTREFVKSDNIVIPFSNYEFMNDGLGLYTNNGLTFHYLSSGRSDALSEIRMHDQSDYERVIDIFSVRHPVQAEFSRALVYKLFNTPICAKIQIPANSLTVLAFAGLPVGMNATFEIRANGVSWPYLLPYNVNGGEMAFGTGPRSRHSLLIRNSDAKPKVLQFYFYPPAELQDSKMNLGTVTGYPVVAADRYLSLPRLLPFEVDLDAPWPAMVETPRIFLQGYVAEVDGQRTPVLKSPEGLVSVPVAAGVHRVGIFFEPSPLLKYSYRLAIAAWLYFIGAGAFLFFRRPRPAVAT